MFSDVLQRVRDLDSAGPDVAEAVLPDAFESLVQGYALELLAVRERVVADIFEFSGRGEALDPAVRERLRADSFELAVFVELHVHELLTVNERLVWYFGNPGGNLYLREPRVGEAGTSERSRLLAEYGTAQSRDAAECIRANCLDSSRERNFYQPVRSTLGRSHRSAELSTRYHSA